jgi:hypothetical protein
VDGGYTLYIDRIVQLNSHLHTESFVTPIRKSRGVNLAVDELEYNQMLGGFRSAIESRFGELGHLFRRFNGKSVIRVSEEAMFTMQLKLACVLSNMKNFIAMGQLQHEHSEHHTYWMHTGFDYYNGNISINSLYDTVDVLSIADRRAQKEKIELIQQQLFALSIDEINSLEVRNNNSNNNDIEEVIMEEDDVNYEVERIIEHRHTEQGTQYKVKWIGYDNRHNKWLLASDFNSGNMVEEYLLSQAEARS